MVKPHLEHTFARGGNAAYDDVASGPFDQVNELASDYAESRAAKLVTDISDTTRDRLNELIQEAIDDGLSPADLSDEIVGLGDFDEARADMIARTELATAQSEGAIAGWRASGVVAGKEWLPGGDSCDICDENADDGEIDLEATFASGDDAPPAHPNCTCDLAAVVDESDEEE